MQRNRLKRLRHKRVMPKGTKKAAPKQFLRSRRMKTSLSIRSRMMKASLPILARMIRGYRVTKTGKMAIASKRKFGIRALSRTAAFPPPRLPTKVRPKLLRRPRTERDTRVRNRTPALRPPRLVTRFSDFVTRFGRIWQQKMTKSGHSPGSSRQNIQTFQEKQKSRNREEIKEQKRFVRRRNQSSFE